MEHERGSHPGEREREDASLGRREEELRVAKRGRNDTVVRVGKRVETERVEETVPRVVEQAGEVERMDANADDSGEIETLPDGSVSIPVFEEQLVVTKRTVVRERIVVRKQAITEEQRVESELRKERVEVTETPLDEIETLLGRDVRDAEGERVGRADLVLVDPDTGGPAWVGIRSGVAARILGRRELLLAPLTGADFEGEEIRLRWSKALIEKAPTVDEDKEPAVFTDAEDAVAIPPEKEEEAYAHYSLQRLPAEGPVRFRRWRLGGGDEISS